MFSRKSSTTMTQLCLICFVIFLCTLNQSTTVSSYTISKSLKGIIPEFESIDSMESRENGENKNSKNKCQPLTIAMCRRLGYNTTSTKESIYSNGLKGTDIEMYLSYFENEICFEDLLFFVCTLFNPICFKNHDKPVLPCKSACLNVRKECKRTIERFHAHWPLQLNCDNLPDYQTSVCIKRESIIAKTQINQENSSADLSTDRKQRHSLKQCSNCFSKERNLHSYRQFQESDYAIEGQFLSKTNTADGGIKLKFHVRKVFKRAKVNIEKYGYVDIWSNDSCLCPYLEYDNKYILLGHENKENLTLWFNEKTVAVRKTRFRKRLMLLWKRIYREMQKRVHNLRRSRDFIAHF